MVDNYMYVHIQVFLDEVNTSSCVGLFKEIIVDRTFDGEVNVYLLLIIVCTTSVHVNIRTVWWLQ